MLIYMYYVYRSIFVLTKSFCKQDMVHPICASAHSMRSVSRTQEANYEAPKTDATARMEAMRDQGKETKNNTGIERKGKVADLETRMRSFHRRQKVLEKKEGRRGSLWFLPY